LAIKATAVAFIFIVVVIIIVITTSFLPAYFPFSSGDNLPVPFPNVEAISLGKLYLLNFLVIWLVVQLLPNKETL
jgi:hypothetical protein